MSEEEYIEQKFFEEDNYIKIKKKLIYEIALARIKEISEIILFKNINFENCNKASSAIFLEIEPNVKLNGLGEIYKLIFSKNGKINLNYINDLSTNSIMNTVNKLVHFGWKKEAIPITQTKDLIRSLKQFLAKSCYF